MRKTKLVTLLGGICLLLILTALPFMAACAPAKPAPAPAPAPKPAPAPAPKPAPKPESPAEFFKNNTVTLLVNSKPGGSTDYMGRLIASFWGEVTGGAMVVKNEPAGAGKAAINIVYGSKPDGLLVGETYPGSQVVMPTLLGDPAVKYDARKFSWIGRTHQSPFMLNIGIKVPAESVEDLQKMEEFRFVASGPDDARTIDAVIVAEILGLKAKVATGFRSADIILALLRGEADGVLGGAASANNFIDKGAAKQPFLALSFERTEWFPDVPAIAELVTLTPEQEDWVRFALIAKGGTTFFVAPDTPKDRLQFMRDAFDKIVAHDGYKKQAKRLYTVLIPTKGVDMAKEIEEGLATSKVVAKLKEIRAKYLAIEKK